MSGEPPRDLKIRPLAERRNLVRREQFARVPPPLPGFRQWFEALPDILGAVHLKKTVAAVVEARKAGRHVAVALGAHVLKVGLAPLLVDLMERGVITHVATNGAGAVHDFETALIGETSEEVASGLEDGSFGFWRETFEGLSASVARARDRKEGFGAALGRLILERNLPHASLSVFAAAARLGLPATIHAAVGCDIVHMDPELDGAALGEATLRDFWILAETVAALEGGVWLNVGSAVIMPEVFLKAVSAARNRGLLGKGFVTANFDMMHQYRALTNVVDRPPREGYSVLGQHEILLPLFREAVLSCMA